MSGKRAYLPDFLLVVRVRVIRRGFDLLSLLKVDRGGLVRAGVLARKVLVVGSSSHVGRIVGIRVVASLALGNLAGLGLLSVELLRKELVEKELDWAEWVVLVRIRPLER